MMWSTQINLISATKKLFEVKITQKISQNS